MQQQIELMEIGCIGIFAAYNLVLFNQIRRRYYLYLGLLSLSIFIRATLVDDGSMIFFTFFPNATIELGKKIEYFCGYINMPFCILFYSSLYPYENLKKYIKIFVWLSIALMVFVLSTPYSVFHQAIGLGAGFVVVLYVFMFILLVRAIRQRKVGAIYAGIGTFLSLFFVFAEILRLTNIWEIDAGPNLINSGYMVSIFFLSVALSEIFAASFRENKELNKNLEVRVQEKTRAIKRSNLLRDTLIRIVSHDIRGPLSNLKSVITLIKEDQVDINQAKEFMKTIDKGVDHTIQMLDELMEWGKAASDDKRIEREEIVLSEILTPLLDHMKTLMEKKAHNFSLNGNLESMVVFDKSGLKVVLRNLLSNAIKFTEKEGRISLGIEEVSGNVLIHIADTGIGIPDKMKENLFEMKRDNKRAGTDNEKSSGVGLFICNDLINQNNGTLEVLDNPEGKGTIFKFYLPKANSFSSK